MNTKHTRKHTRKEDTYPEAIKGMLEYCPYRKTLIWKVGKRAGQVAGTQLRGRRCIKFRSLDGVVYQVQNLIWWLHYGEIPPRYLVSYKDWDTTNTAIENLVLRTNGEIQEATYELGMRAATTKQYLDEKGIVIERTPEYCKAKRKQMIEFYKRQRDGI